MFKNAKIGDKVWSCQNGETKITKIDNKSEYPICTEVNSRLSSGQSRMINCQSSRRGK